ncbi:hypothetical protein ACIBEA_02795 [Streptomyces sp. NPDC051555]|uniref:hypothetical protein n=1 Tax=Streptomyces sp. NPDC051555 TaxID=3365657 RepID=UPI0037B39D82
MTALGTGSTSPCGCGGASAPDLPTDDPRGTACDPGPCAGDEVGANPFLALRVAFGMLLGEDDFRVLMGNPRGKQMLHNAWLHGPGVVWGLGVRREGGELRVVPGLAVDGLGRELSLETSWCVSLTEWAAAWAARHPDPGHAPPDPVPGVPAQPPPCPPAARTVEAWVLAEFATCPDRPVPALADPCDVTRRHDDFSRIVETARITIRSKAPAPWRPYHRVRVLLGLDEVLPGDRAGEEARRAAAEVARVPEARRAPALLEAFRRLAALDATAQAPERAEGDACVPGAPVTEDHAAVVLARLTVEVTQYEECVRIGAVTLDAGVRTAILPTTTVQELLCALAPGLIGAPAAPDAGGPRLVPDSLTWSREHTVLSFDVTAPLTPGSAEPEGVEISSLSDAGRGWADDEVAGIRISTDGHRVKVDLDQRPAYETVRIRVRGTGSKPLYGKDPAVPFAGVVGGPPGTADEGNDAIITVRLPRVSATGRSEE